MQVFDYLRLNDHNVIIEIVSSLVELEVTSTFVSFSYANRDWLGKRIYNDGQIFEIPSRILTPYEFRKKFTISEKIAIETAALTDMEVKTVQKDMDAAQEIDLNDADVIAGLEFLVMKELLTESRKSEILDALI